MKRSFYTRLLLQYQAKIDGINAIEIIISGVYITAMVASFDHGSTSFITMSKRLKMPESLDEMPFLLPPVLKLVYSCVQTTKTSTDKIIQKTRHRLQESEVECYFPPRFHKKEAPNKKRKA
ncbi:hypothetical protein RMATCC62417_17439 [Rhizopus microsporus]|nr:hypothetical protein RMATCC62417_17439 [Rhizopus microsporus]